jgi:predicted Zn-dependent peptidase
MPAHVLPQDPSVTELRLANGLTLIGVQLPHLHSAAVQFLVRAGSRFEEGEAVGLSHFVEHMIYRGSTRFPSAYALNRAIERLGGSLYAETSRELTSYLIEAPPESVGGLLDILADAVTHPRWAELEVEQRIVLEEILEDLDEDGRFIRTDDVVRRLAWGEHPLGQPITGSQETVAAFTKRVASRHHARYYVGENAVLCLATPEPVGPLLRAAAQAFGGLASGARAEPSAAPSAFQRPRLRYLAHRESQTTVNLLLHLLPDSHALAPAQLLLLRVLDDGLSTRLHRRIVDELGLVYGIAASPEVLEDISVLDLSAACAHATTPRLLEELTGLLTELRQRPPEADELDLARKRLVWDYTASLDSPRWMADWHATMALLRRSRSLRERLSQILRVSRNEVLEVASLIVQPERLATVVLGRLSREAQRQVRGQLEAL